MSLPKTGLYLGESLIVSGLVENPTGTSRRVKVGIRVVRVSDLLVPTACLVKGPATGVRKIIIGRVQRLGLANRITTFSTILHFQKTNCGYKNIISLTIGFLLFFCITLLLMIMDY